MPILGKCRLFCCSLGNVILASFKQMGNQFVNNFQLDNIKSLVMCRTPFYRTSIELEHHFSNIERTRTCSLIISRTSIEHRTNIEHFSYFDDA